MKTIKKGALAALALLVTACSKDDGTTEPNNPDPTNRAPEPFQLTEPVQDENRVSRLPTLRWEEAIDPDEDAVTYDLYLDKSSTPNTLIAQDLSSTSYTLSEMLDLDTTYYWKVVAKDEEEAVTESALGNFITEFPLEFLKEFTKNLSGGKANDMILKIQYTEDQISIFDVYFVNYEDQFGYLSKLVRDLSTERHDYYYSSTGKQTQVKSSGLPGNGEVVWVIEYDEEDRILNIFNSNITVGTLEFMASFTYPTGDAQRPSEIDIVYEADVSGTVEEGSLQLELVWEGANIITIVTEGTENGDEFSIRMEYEYDTNINPYHVILENQLGLGDFFISNLSTKMETISFGFFNWQSRNNLVSTKRYESSTASDPIEIINYSYNYSDNYYPETATEEIVRGAIQMGNELIWKY